MMMMMMMEKIQKMEMMMMMARIEPTETSNPMILWNSSNLYISSIVVLILAFEYY
jgi:hypothetical protein